MILMLSKWFSRGLISVEILKFVSNNLIKPQLKTLNSTLPSIQHVGFYFFCFQRFFKLIFLQPCKLKTFIGIHCISICMWNNVLTLSIIHKGFHSQKYRFVTHRCVTQKYLDVSFFFSFKMYQFSFKLKFITEQLHVCTLYVCNSTGQCIWRCPWIMSNVHCMLQFLFVQLIMCSTRILHNVCVYIYIHVQALEHVF